MPRASAKSRRNTKASTNKKVKSAKRTTKSKSRSKSTKRSTSVRKSIKKKTTTKRTTPKVKTDTPTKSNRIRNPPERPRLPEIVPPKVPEPASAILLVLPSQRRLRELLLRRDPPSLRSQLLLFSPRLESTNRCKTLLTWTTSLPLKPQPRAEVESVSFLIESPSASNFHGFWFSNCKFKLKFSLNFD